MSPLQEEFTAYLMSRSGSGRLADPEAVSRLVSLATPLTAEAGEVLTRQFAPARALDFLVDGRR